MIRGIDSIANATTPRRRRRSMPSVSVSGERNPISTRSLRESPRPRRRSVGATRTMASDAVERDAGLAHRRARLAYASSAKPAATPAPRSTTISNPSAASRCTASGTSATRRFAGEQTPGAPRTRIGRESTGRDQAPRGEPIARVRLSTPYTAAMEVCDPGLGVTLRGSRLTPRRSPVGSAGTRSDSTTSRLGAALHDVGKVALRPEVLRKPGRSTADELAEVRAHPIEGVWLIAGVRSLARRAALRAVPPRAVGRPRLPDTSCGRRDPARGPDPGGCRRVRRHDVAAAVSRALTFESAVDGDRALLRLPVRPSRGRGVPRGVDVGRDRRARAARCDRLVGARLPRPWLRPASPAERARASRGRAARRPRATPARGGAPPFRAA